MIRNVIDRENPDEKRLPPEAFDELLGGDPWKIVGR